MKTDRLLAIMNILTERDHVTTKELAERFEVSRRTILRDVDSLSMAGVPVITSKGHGGGISLMDGYSYDKRLLKKRELEDMVVGIKSVQSVSTSATSHHLVSRLANIESCISIDLSSHHKNSLSVKIDLLREAINTKQSVSFDYFSPKGRSRRMVDPIKVVYQWGDWYLVSYCIGRQALRVFKLQRLWYLTVEERVFVSHEVEESDLVVGKNLIEDSTFKAVFDPKVEYLVAESYGPDSYELLKDGRLLLSGHYTNEDFIVRWLLSFGKDVEVTEPKSLIAKLKEQVKKF